MQIEIYVATHKQFEMPTKEDIYLPIFGGASLNSNHNFGYILDNSGDNISSKNKNYNEMTSFYWVWKNSTADIKGLCHYRRFFFKSYLLRESKYLLNKKDIEEDLKEVDIILPYPVFPGPKLPINLIGKNMTNYRQYIKLGSGIEQDLYILRDVVMEKYPEYVKDYDQFMKDDHGYFCNSLIAKREVFDNYAEWIFDILFEFEKRIDMTVRQGQQLRIFGFLSERLLNVWVNHNNLKIKHYMLLQIDGKPTKPLKRLIEKAGLSKLLLGNNYYFKKRVCKRSIK